MSSRIPCCILGCRRTHRNDEGYAEWICSRHWRLVPRRLRRLHRARVKRMRHAWEYWEAVPTRASMDEYRRLQRQAQRCWETCKRRAMNSALGL